MRLVRLFFMQVDFFLEAQRLRSNLCSSRPYKVARKHVEAPFGRGHRECGFDARLCLNEWDSAVARFAFISDIHANIEALRGVMTALERARPDGIICLGDLVGYGPHPEACIDMVLDRCDYTVQGNHDRAVVDDAELSRFNAGARAAIQYTRDRLSDAHHRKLAALPCMGNLDQVVVTHANPDLDAPSDYLNDPSIAAAAFGAFDAHCLFVGHTHIPMAFGTPDIGYARVEPADVRIAFLPPNVPLRLDSKYRYILNPGSVGQPRDGNPDASYGILDTEKRTFTVSRVAYDVEAVQRDMIRAGLPNFLSDRLRIGA